MAAVKSRKTSFVPVKLSLSDLAGSEYCESVCSAHAVLTHSKITGLRRMARKKVDFFPASMHKRLCALLPQTGRRTIKPFKETAAGAATNAFAAATRVEQAPLGCYGYFRTGEDGRLHFILKSEHYHAALGHAFPGYRLLETARKLGVANATHNNTRGHLTRKLEMELIQTANGIGPGDRNSLNRILQGKSGSYINRVLNLETGSLAMEAALKAMLSRFYASQQDQSPPPYAGRIPVLAVIGNDEGGLQANYHGTAMIPQMLRGMWTPLMEKLEKHRVLLVRNVRPNAWDQLRALFVRYERPPYKIAGFLHEFVMMNYGGRVLSRDFVRRAYAECRRLDIPTCADEIQSCLWHPDMFMLREYGVRPDLIAAGKGLGGGEYPASRLLLNKRMDNLGQFGALVTNGQEEMASLAYLISMQWARYNAPVTRAVGDYYEERLREWAAGRKNFIVDVHGRRHLLGIEFSDMARAVVFVNKLQKRGLDISVQTYKVDAPPVALTKLPIISGYETVDWLINVLREEC